MDVSWSTTKYTVTIKNLLIIEDKKFGLLKFVGDNICV